MNAVNSRSATLCCAALLLVCTCCCWTSDAQAATSCLTAGIKLLTACSAEFRAIQGSNFNLSANTLLNSTQASWSVECNLAAWPWQETGVCQALPALSQVMQFVAKSLTPMKLPTQGCCRSSSHCLPKTDPTR